MTLKIFYDFWMRPKAIAYNNSVQLIKPKIKQLITNKLLFDYENRTHT